MTSASFHLHGKRRNEAEELYLESIQNAKRQILEHTGKPLLNYEVTEEVIDGKYHYTVKAK